MGLKILLDTNAVVALLKNEPELMKIVSSSSEIYVSIISELEFLSFGNLSLNDTRLFNIFIKQVKVVDINHSNRQLKNLIIEIRTKYRLKLPDTIIAASAIMLNCSLMSRDKEFSKVKELKLIDWN